MAAELPVAPAALPGLRPEPGPASASVSRSRSRLGPESASRPRLGQAPRPGPASRPVPRPGLAPESGPGPEPAPGPSRPPAARGQEKRARPEGPPAAAPQQKRSRPALGTGAAKAPPRAPLRSLCPAAAAGKNNGPRKAASVGPAPRTGSATSTGAKGASKRSPWDLRGKVGYLREALRQAQEERQELEVCVGQQRERLQQQERELAERETRESSLCASIGSLEAEVSQCREELQTSRRQLAALEAEQRQLEAEKQQREQERDTALAQAQALTKELDSAWVQLQETQQQLQEKLQEFSVLQEQEASERALLAVYEDRILQLEMERRRLHNDIQELRGNIRVFCRVRPLLPEEEQRQLGLPHLHFPSEDPRSLLLTRPDDSQVGRERRAELRYNFSFDRVFPPLASQQDIFEEIQLLVQSALDGFPVCIFAYGQTGSGKTFTMEGPAPPGGAESRGMIPRAVRQLFLGARDLAGKGWQYVFSASYLEIYNESLRDLLLARGEPPPELEIRRLAPNSDELHVPNLTWVPVQSEEQVEMLRF
ncbi:kinesin-like protein KIFC1 [Haemorhous mexicanus]|uniref:kinesin-like protein KIFC1 n=1 Tax=Haemorhous mexicanus TaxID=30427 RepID=UPI0028BE4203|nr:kinesin-like protein KIFC1 [Haemorhous mexicanus]